MAIVYDFFGRKPPFSTEDVEKNNESVYFKHLDELFEDLKAYVKEERLEDGSFDPLSSIFITPRNKGTTCTVMSFRSGDSQDDLIIALEVALQKVREMQPI